MVYCNICNDEVLDRSPQTMERRFNSFRDASAFAATYCQEHRVSGRLSRDGEDWIVIVDSPYSGKSSDLPPKRSLPAVRSPARLEAPSAQDFMEQQWEAEKSRNQEQIERRRAMLEHSKGEAKPTKDPGRWEACHQCGGDGGAGGRCPRCGGNGFEPSDVN